MSRSLHPLQKHSSTALSYRQNPNPKAMEDSFKVRVDRIFGSLASSSSTSAVTADSSSSSLRSLWSLTDDEIERKEWSRDKRSPELPLIKPGLNLGHRKELENDLEDLEDEKDYDFDDTTRDGSSSSQSAKPEDYNDEEWEIKSSIGRDCTLDYEEEEDAYDKVAVGRENAGNRLYMKDVNDYGICIDHGDELPTSFSRINRDPRANHMAAKLRLKEDAEAAGKIDSLQVSEMNLQERNGVHVPTTEDDVNVKSILKRKDGQSESKTQKRVRFDPEIKEEEYRDGGDVQMEADSTEQVNKANDVPVPAQDFSSAVPDYLRNPFRYTHYTFDNSDDMDEQSNRQAYADLLDVLKKSKGTHAQADEAPELPKSVTFIPRKKTSDVGGSGNYTQSKQDQKDVDKEPANKKGISLSIAAGDAQESEVTAMDEDRVDDMVDRRNNSVRVGRHYRTKAGSEADD